MITKEHTAVFGGGKDACASNLYIDHLTPDQLRRRAADSRADALALADRLSAESVAMLLTSADRCEIRASLLEYMATSTPNAPRFHVGMSTHTAHIAVYLNGIKNRSDADRLWQ